MATQSLPLKRNEVAWRDQASYPGRRYINHVLVPLRSMHIDGQLLTDAHSSSAASAFALCAEASNASVEAASSLRLLIANSIIGAMQ